MPFEIAENCGCPKGATCLVASGQKICGHYMDTPYARDVAIFSADCLLKKKMAAVIAEFKNPPRISVKNNSFGISNDDFKVVKNGNNFEVLLRKPFLLQKQKNLASVQISLDFATNSLHHLLLDLVFI